MVKDMSIYIYYFSLHKMLIPIKFRTSTKSDYEAKYKKKYLVLSVLIALASSLIECHNIGCQLIIMANLTDAKIAIFVA